MFEEFVCHALLTYDEVKRWWFASPLALKIDIQEGSQFKDWIGRILNATDEEVIASIFEFLHSVWHARNMSVFEKKHIKFEQSVEYSNFPTPSIFSKLTTSEPNCLMVPSMRRAHKSQF